MLNSFFLSFSIVSPYSIQFKKKIFIMMKYKLITLKQKYVFQINKYLLTKLKIIKIRLISIKFYFVYLLEGLLLLIGLKIMLELLFNFLRLKLL